MPRRLAVLAAAMLCLAAAPSVARADTPIGGCPGPGLVTDRGSKTPVYAHEGASKVVGGDFTVSPNATEEMLFRLQVIPAHGEPPMPTVSWRIDGGPWHGTDLHVDRNWWENAAVPIGHLTAGSHRAEVSLTAPTGGDGPLYMMNGYFDGPAPCHNLAGWVSIPGIQVYSSDINPMDPDNHPSAKPSARAAAPTRTTATRSTGPSTEPSPSAAEGSATPSPAASDSPTPMAAPTPTPTPSASGTSARPLAVEPAAARGGGSGPFLVLGLGIVALGGATAGALVTVARRRRAAAAADAEIAE